MKDKKTDYAVNGLKASYPHMSAYGIERDYRKLIFQVGLGGVALVPVVYWTKGDLLFFVLAAAFSLALLMRYFMVMSANPPMRMSFHQQDTERDFPVYTLLVPLFKEANILSDLVRALEAINYPADKLDIKIILEQADNETRLAAQRMTWKSHFEIIIVPDSPPRTKGKACNYALQTARGDFCVIYDAEDRPDPDQLARALYVFDHDGENLACVQTPLTFYNWEENWLTKMFSIEYLVQFFYFLPWTAKHNLPSFLGGTSNHFRTDILRKILAWDPYNVTEDADIGLRLHRFGYRVALVPSLTEEEATCRSPDWMKQRTRWIKGWLQTWLVARRDTKGLRKEIGWRSYLFLQFLVPFYVLSVLGHLVSWVGVVVLFFYQPTYSLYIVGVNFANYAFVMLLALHSLRILPSYKRKKLRRVCWTIFIYWFFLGAAMVRALAQLFTDPYHWEKTPHLVKPNN